MTQARRAYRTFSPCRRYSELDLLVAMGRIVTQHQHDNFPDCEALQAARGLGGKSKRLAKITSAAMRITPAKGCDTSRPHQPLRADHSRTDISSPTTNPTQEPAGLSSPPSASMAVNTRQCGAGVPVSRSASRIGTLTAPYRARHFDGTDKSSRGLPRCLVLRLAAITISSTATPPSEIGLVGYGLA